MIYNITNNSPLEVECDLLVLPVLCEALEGPGTGTLRRYAAASGVDLGALAQEEGFAGKPGQTLMLRGLGGAATRRVVLVGVGKAEDVALGALRQVGVTAARCGRQVRARVIGVCIAEPVRATGLHEAQAMAQLYEGFSRSIYRFERYLSTKEVRQDSFERLVLIAPDADTSPIEAALATSHLISEAVSTARNLVNEIPSVLTPFELGVRATSIATCNSLEHHVLDVAQLTERGFNLILAVGKGSDNPPCLIHLVYRPQGPVHHKVALVGKGVTFDTGGYSIKGGEHMLHMHSDMAGAAAVLAAAQAIGKLRPPGIEIHFIAPAVENAINGRAIKPQDIVKGYGGKTVEILNTDAEGRLILADALAYAQEQGVQTIVDLATLTGAIVVALGECTAGLFSNDDGLAQQLLGAAHTAGEDLWRMPLTQKLDARLETPMADMKNIGGRTGGAITAALFLKRWVELERWAHIDLAGPAWMETESTDFAQGGTGYGVSTLVYFIQALAHEYREGQPIARNLAK